MKAKLCKIDKEYFLHSIENNLIATSDNLHINCLSMKNCESIERGYDLDELVNEEFSKFDQEARIVYRRQLQESLANMFSKALELMDDKKFSEEDMHEAYSLGEREDRSGFHGLLNSKQQTEWDVELIMEIVDYGLDEGGNPQYSKEAKLDPNGCLILKIAK
jgi:hypothetical protein